MTKIVDRQHQRPRPGPSAGGDGGAGGGARRREGAAADVAEGSEPSTDDAVVAEEHDAGRAGLRAAAMWSIVCAGVSR